MSLIEAKHIVYINSENRVSGTDSNFTYNLNVTSTEYDHICALQISVPKSYYLVQSPFNTFTLNEDGDTVEITLDPGNYTRQSLKTILTNVLNQESPNGWTYAVTYPTSSEAETGKLIFTVTGNTGLQPQFIFTTNLYKVLGFDDNSTNVFVGDELESTNVINLQRESTLFIHSNIVANPTDNILQEIYSNDTSEFSPISYQCLNVEASSKPLSNIPSSANFYLTDEAGTPINLNGQNMLITLMLYKKESMTKLLKNVLKLELLK
jgi:hypothetical protein